MTTRFNTVNLHYWRIFCVLLCAAQVWTTLVRLEDFNSFFGHAGLLSIETLRSQFPTTSLFSILSYVNSDRLTAAFFFISIISTILAGSGRYPLVMWPLSWYLCWSIQSRNELILNGADHYLRILFFWAMIVEVSRALENKTKSKDREFTHWSVGLYLYQVLAIYFFSGMHKLFYEAWRNGSALNDILGYTILVRPWTAMMFEYPKAVLAGSYLILVFELGFPIAFLALRFTKAAKWLWFGAMAFHIAIMVSMKLYLIPIMGLISLVPLCPSDEQRQPHSESESVKPMYWLTAALIGYLFVINISGLPYLNRPLEKASQFFTYVRLDQNWSFFAPPPDAKYQDWWELKLETAQGEVSRFLDGELGKDAQPPTSKYLSQRFMNQHWAAYSINMAARKNSALAENGLRYFCQVFHQESHRSIDFTLYHEQEAADGALSQWQDNIASISCP